MSSFVYGVVSAQRAKAPAGKSKTDLPPGMGTYVDTLAGLVPAEALALYEVVLALVTKGTIITHRLLLERSCIVLLVLASVLYLIGRKNLIPSLLDVPRLLIPPAALAAWMLVQTPSVWDIWWHGSDSADRLVTAAFAAVVLGILANALGYLADKAPAPAITRVKPNQGTPGAKVTLTGSGFTGVTEVSFDGAAGQILSRRNDTKLRVTSPPHADGTVDVKVTTAAGVSPASVADKFTYQPAGAAVAPVIPPDGAGAGN